jgi:hypothetical protein
VIFGLNALRFFYNELALRLGYNSERFHIATGV